MAFDPPAVGPPKRVCRERGEAGWVGERSMIASAILPYIIDYRLLVNNTANKQRDNS